MLKVLKEILIYVLLILLIILVFGILFYDQLPSNKLVPTQQDYALPENLESALEDTLSDEDLERIWGRFYKVDESRHRADGGTGIGLAIVKAIMNNYNLKYGAVNRENGIEFYFDIKISKN